MPDQLNTCTEQQLYHQQFTGKSSAKQHHSFANPVDLFVLFVLG